MTTRVRSNPMLAEYFGEGSSAAFSLDKTYRYSLWRQLHGELLDPPGTPCRTVCWVMLNPSTADEAVDDNTLRRVIGYSKRERFERVVVVNLYALRSSNPRDLLDHPDPVGPVNEEMIAYALGLADRVIVGWGAWAGNPRLVVAPDVAAMATAAGIQLWCLGTNPDGTPRHPRVLRKDAELVPWP